MSGLSNHQCAILPFQLSVTGIEIRPIAEVKPKCFSNPAIAKKELGQQSSSDPKTIALFIRSKVSGLFAWKNSEAVDEEAFWMCCLGLWCFIIDDVLNEKEYFSHPKKTV
jgi:hypothetical protein